MTKPDRSGPGVNHDPKINIMRSATSKAVNVQKSAGKFKVSNQPRRPITLAKLKFMGEK